MPKGLIIPSKQQATNNKPNANVKVQPTKQQGVVKTSPIAQKSNANTVKQSASTPTLSPLAKVPNGIKPSTTVTKPTGTTTAASVTKALPPTTKSGTAVKPGTATVKPTTTAKPAVVLGAKPITTVKSNIPVKPSAKPVSKPVAAKSNTESTTSLPPLSSSRNNNTNKDSKVNNLKINMDEVLEENQKEGEVISKEIESSVKKFDTGTKSFVVNIRYIGRGNCAVVYKGVHVPSLTVVAIKEVKIIDEAIRKQFNNELNALSCNRVFMTTNGILSLPPCNYIVSFYDVFNDETKGRTCIVMEYMDGGSLQDIITHNEGGIRDENALYNISYAILKGIYYLHNRHMIHRDIKPSNLLINHFGDVKLSDFGIVKELCNSYGIADTFVGTLPYMSPSRIAAEEYSYGSDIWSFGLSIYVLAKGEFPYDKDKDYWTILEQIKDNPAPRLSTKEFSKEFCSFIEMCLNKDESKIPTINDLFTHPFIKGKKTVRSQNVYYIII